MTTGPEILPFSFDFNVKEAPCAAEHRRFAEKAARGHEEIRTQRLKDLRRRRSSIADAVKAYEALCEGLALNRLGSWKCQLADETVASNRQRRRRSVDTPGRVA
jgi:hypothetical protein